MTAILKKPFRIIPLISEKAGKSVAKRCLRKLIQEQKKEVLGELANDYPELLLHGMEWAFYLSKDYRKNIENFEGKYIFKTLNGKKPFEASVTFKNGRMQFHPKAIQEYDVKVTFENAAGLKAFLFSEDDDILNSILENKVWIDRNWNYLYKFGFMARDLIHRICGD
jgi:hypothetical protein